MLSRLSPGWKRLSLGVFFSLLALGLSGCGRTAQVSGTVKYQGNLLTSGRVIFVDPENRATPPASIRADGTYLAPIVPVGPVTILIGNSPPLPPESGDKESPEYKNYEAKLAAHLPLPERYMDLKESGKTFAVKSGSNVCNIELD